MHMTARLYLAGQTSKLDMMTGVSRGHFHKQGKVHQPPNWSMSMIKQGCSRCGHQGHIATQQSCPATAWIKVQKGHGQLSHGIVPRVAKHILASGL